jgi:hypothetical protein
VVVTTYLDARDHVKQDKAQTGQTRQQEQALPCIIRYSRRISRDGSGRTASYKPSPVLSTRTVTRQAEHHSSSPRHCIWAGRMAWDFVGTLGTGILIVRPCHWRELTEITQIDPDTADPFQTSPPAPSYHVKHCFASASDTDRFGPAAGPQWIPLWTTHEKSLVAVSWMSKTRLVCVVASLRMSWPVWRSHICGGSAGVVGAHLHSHQDACKEHENCCRCFSRENDAVVTVQTTPGAGE